jgi:glycogen debranching enzyme
MKIIHRLNEKEVFKDIPVNSKEAAGQSFLLTDKKGGFFLQGAKTNFSRYCGSFFSVKTEDGWEMFKTIEQIRLLGKEPDTIRNNFWNIERISLNTIERFWICGRNTILYEIDNFKGFCEFILDCRYMYDSSDMGRIYKITKESDLIIIEYKKYRDSGLKEICYEAYIAISGAEGYIENNSWEKADYPYDRIRGTLPSEVYVYNAIKLEINDRARLAVSYSNSKEEALKNARYAKENYEFIKNSVQNTKIRALGKRIGINDKTELAMKCAVNSIDSLAAVIDNKMGIFAGLPWFHHFWTRDEAISIKSLILEERYGEAKEILIRLLHLMLPDGKISNRYPFAKLGSADSVGWTFKRIHELLLEFEEMKIQPGIITADNVVFAKNRLRFSIEQILTHHTEGGLVECKNLESWMDTSYKSDNRGGFLIEIQALELAMYKLMQFLCTITQNHPKYEAYKNLEEATKKKVRQEFWKSPELYDGKNDPTIRPNIFLAYYIYPDLLTTEEWTKCFDNAIEKLWLNWGGFSTIDKKHPLFSERYTGENNKSYHRGDSWFFINNIAAICLYRVDSERYKDKIAKILEASTEDLLFRGTVGHASELSSAEEQRPEGCLCQAWSAATFVEMVYELHKK